MYRSSLKIKWVGKTCVSCSLLFMTFMLLSLPAFSAEGRTPVFLYGTNINQPGKYILTRNLTLAAGGPAGVFINVSDVDLDLNGFTIDANNGGTGVVVNPFADHVRIHNGIIGPMMAGGVSCALCVDVVGPNTQVTVENIKCFDFSSYGIKYTTVTDGAIRRTEIRDGDGPGISWGGSAAGAIENCAIQSVTTGIEFVNATNGQIVDNQISVTEADGISIKSSRGVLVSENTVDSAGQYGIVLVTSFTVKLFDNVVTSSTSHGIYLNPGSSDNLILNNISARNGKIGIPPFSDGLLIQGGRNLVDRNLLTGNSNYGLHFSGGASACRNTFGRNTARGNNGGVCPIGGGLTPPDSCDETSQAICGIAQTNSSYGDNLIAPLQ